MTADHIRSIDMWVGELSRAWSELEEGLVLAIGQVSLLPTNDLHATFLRMLSTNSRLDALEMAAEQWDHDDWVREVQGVCRYIREVLKPRRNLLIHGRWLTSESEHVRHLRDMRPRLVAVEGRRQMRVHRDLEVGQKEVLETTDATREELRYLAHLVLWLVAPSEPATWREKRPPRLLRALGS